MKKFRKKKVFKKSLSKNILLYEKNNGKKNWDEKKTKSKIPLFFSYSKTFLLRDFLNGKNLEKKKYSKNPSIKTFYYMKKTMEKKIGMKKKQSPKFHCFFHIVKRFY
jgi:hypothetical protein